MSLNDNDQPLGEQFLQNPYQFFQSFVRDMNNQVFLSQYQLSHLYALLLLKIQAPCDDLKPNTPSFKLEIQEIVNNKIAEVKRLLESLSQVYEQKVKKTTFNQIERLMSILKAKNKSIFIQKHKPYFNNQIHQLNAPYTKSIQDQINQKFLDCENSSIQQIQKQKNHQLQNGINSSNPPQKCQHSCQTSNHHQKQLNEGESKNKMQAQDFASIIKDEKVEQNKKSRNEEQQSADIQNGKARQSGGDQKQVLGLFYGIANLPNLSSLALGNCLEYSSAQRFIKFKMSKNYIMTIKNQDQQPFDRNSTLQNVSSDLFTHHIFPYLTAIQLFKARGVCREWMQNVKQAWHSTFKREMFIQLMACEFCKEIQYYYKLIQLRNPFFQKVSLLMHALLEIIQWDRVYESVNENTILPQLKKVLIILLKLLGQQINTPNLNSITEQVWLEHKEKTLSLKARLSQFLNNIDSSALNIRQLMRIKVQLLDDPFMRVQQLNSQDKTPLLLVIFIKQLTLQQILKNHIFFSQQYLMNIKRKLDNISSKMPRQKGFLEGVYKVLLLRSIGGGKSQKQEGQEQRSQLPNFQQLINSIFSPNQQPDKPDFVIRHKSSYTNIYMDKATKLDIIISTVNKMNAVTPQTSQTYQVKQQAQMGLPTTHSQQSQFEVENEQGKQQPKIHKKQLKTVNIYNINLQQNQSQIRQKSQNNQVATNTQNEQFDQENAQRND